MRILIVGGNGFIGRHLNKACVAEGHEVLLAVRDAGANEIDCDLVHDIDTSQWAPRLRNIDGVINCVGLLHAPAVVMQAVHCNAPAAIASACAKAHIPFVHISVLGLDHSADTPYFQSKRQGEWAIRAANSAAIIVRPSVVFGTDSPATRLMLLQSRLPIFFLPAETQPVAPIHVDDLAQLCVCLIGTLRAFGCDVDCVGDTEVSIAEYMQRLRARDHHSAAHVIPIPNKWMRAALAASARCGARTMTPEVLDLMEHAHIGNPHTFARWMRRAPRPIEAFLAA